MSLVNIAEEGNTDAHYRYKRELLQLKVEGRGNGIKTVITNIVRVAEQLKVPPEYPTKFFGIECAAQSKYDKKTKQAVVNGKFDLKEMETTLQNFIKKFVLCHRCKLPECSYEISKSGDDLKMNCSACGHVSTPHDRLVTFILKHPPSTLGLVIQKGAATGDHSNNSTTNTPTIKKKALTALEDDDLLEPEDQVQWSEDTSDEAVERRRREEGLSDNISALTGVSTGTGPSSSSGTTTDGTTTESDSAGNKALADKKKALEEEQLEEENMMNRTDEHGRVAPQFVLIKYLNLHYPTTSLTSKNRSDENEDEEEDDEEENNGGSGDNDLNSLYHAVKQLQSIYELSDKHLVSVMMESIFSHMYLKYVVHAHAKNSEDGEDDGESDNLGEDGEKVPLVSRMQLYAPLLRKVLNQHYQDKVMMAYTEDYIASTYHHSEGTVERAEVLKQVATLFLVMYQQDVIHDPSVIVEWIMSTKKSKMVKDVALVQKMRAAARPFAKWAMDKGLVSTD